MLVPAVPAVQIDTALETRQDLLIERLADITGGEVDEIRCCAGESEFESMLAAGGRWYPFGLSSLVALVGVLLALVSGAMGITVAVCWMLTHLVVMPMVKAACMLATGIIAGLSIDVLATFGFCTAVGVCLMVKYVRFVMLW
jgi:hypothetical protein